MLAQITKKRFQHILAQITGDNFFSMKGQVQKRGVCYHKSQLTDSKMC